MSAPSEPSSSEAVQDTHTASPRTAGVPRKPKPNELLLPYEAMLQRRRLDSTSHFHLLRLLGKGGQGSVFLTELRGSHDFTVPIALKIFSANFRLPGQFLDVGQRPERRGLTRRVD